MAQQPAPTFETGPMPDGAAKPAYAVGVTEPRPVPKKFAFTFNPLNLLIGRYGFNFEYQAVPHHGLIVTPHFDHIALSESDSPYTDTLNGMGVELGYRFYTGSKGFNGFFVGPSLLLAKGSVDYEASGSTVADQYRSINRSFSTIGGAIDVGGQWQFDHFVIGIGVGIQYTRRNQDLYNIGFLLAANAGGSDLDGLLPRLAFNLGYAF